MVYVPYSQRIVYGGKKKHTAKLFIRQKVFHAKTLEWENTLYGIFTTFMLYGLYYGVIPYGENSYS